MLKEGRSKSLRNGYNWIGGGQRMCCSSRGWTEIEVETEAQITPTISAKGTKPEARGIVSQVVTGDGNSHGGESQSGNARCVDETSRHRC